MLTLPATQLLLFQTQATSEGIDANWWLWLVILLLLSVFVAWLLSRESGQPASPAVPVPTKTDPVVEPAGMVATTSPIVDDLTLIEGVGPKINSVLHNAGIHTFADLAGSDVERLRQILLEAGLRVNNPASWPQQAALAAAGKLDELKALQARLDAGRQPKQV